MHGTKHAFASFRLVKLYQHHCAFYARMQGGKVKQVPPLFDCCIKHEFASRLGMKRSSRSNRLAGFDVEKEATGHLCREGLTTWSSL